MQNLQLIVANDDRQVIGSRSQVELAVDTASRSHLDPAGLHPPLAEGDALFP